MVVFLHRDVSKTGNAIGVENKTQKELERLMEKGKNLKDNT